MEIADVPGNVAFIKNAICNNTKDLRHKKQINTPPTTSKKENTCGQYVKTGCCHGTNKQKICSTEIRKTPAATTREKITPAATNPQTHMHHRKKESACCNDANRNAPATMRRRKHQPHALPTAPLNRPCYQAPYVACRLRGPSLPLTRPASLMPPYLC